MEGPVTSEGTLNLSPDAVTNDIIRTYKQTVRILALRIWNAVLHQIILEEMRFSFLEMKRVFQESVGNNFTVARSSLLWKFWIKLLLREREIMSSCITRWNVKQSYSMLGYQARCFELSSSIKGGCSDLYEEEDVKLGSLISLNRALFVSHVYSNWDSVYDTKQQAGGIASQWTQVANAMQRLPYLEKIMVERVQSEDFFAQGGVLSGMKFLRRLIESWAEDDADPEDTETDPQRAKFNTWVESAFFFMDAETLEALRTDLRQGRRDSDMQTVQAYMARSNNSGSTTAGAV